MAIEFVRFARRRRIAGVGAVETEVWKKGRTGNRRKKNFPEGRKRVQTGVGKKRVA